MKITISGAGELGVLLAKTLSHDNDVYMIEPKTEKVEHWEERLDVTFVHGSSTEIITLKEALTDKADYFIATSGDESENILSCFLARKLGAKHTICRLFRGYCFSQEDNITPQNMGIDFCFSTPDVASRKLVDVLDCHELLEQIHFAVPDARVGVVRISPDCQIHGTRLRDIKCPELLPKIRIAAMIHGDQFIIPQGDSILGTDDRIYIAGCEKDVLDFVRWLYPNEKHRKSQMVVVGGGEMAYLFVEKAYKLGYDISVIFHTPPAPSRFESWTEHIRFFVGNPTDSDLLEEVGVESVDLFVSASDQMEDNILSGVLAKRLGAGKIITITRSAEFILPIIDKIDCGFCETIVSANEVFRAMKKTALRKDPYLERVGAAMTECVVTEKSPLKDKMMREMPRGMLIALVFREEKVIAPNGNTILRVGDAALLFSTKKMLPKLKSYFPE